MKRMAARTITDTGFFNANLVIVCFLFVAGVINIYLAKGSARAEGRGWAPLLQILSIRYPHPQAFFRLKKICKALFVLTQLELVSTGQTK
jgi:hypothetical protein